MADVYVVYLANGAKKVVRSLRLNKVLKAEKMYDYVERYLGVDAAAIVLFAYKSKRHWRAIRWLSAVDVLHARAIGAGMAYAHWVAARFGKDDVLDEILWLSLNTKEKRLLRWGEEKAE